MYEADLCSGCGQPRTYSMDKSSRDHYHVGLPFGCNACRALGDARKSNKKFEPHQYYSVQPDEGLAAAMEAGPVRDDPYATFLADLEQSKEA